MRVTSRAGTPSRAAVTAAFAAGPPAATSRSVATTFSFAEGTRVTVCTTSSVASPHASTTPSLAPVPWIASSGPVPPAALVVSTPPG